MAARLDLRGVSLVCVETRAPALALFAMQRCMAVADFQECLLLGARPDSLPEGITHIDIGPLASIQAYSEFMIRRLGDHTRGEHVLVIQWDGFILHPECWTDDFLTVDYIGAPWWRRAVPVGNGGFSLRSRRLLTALRALNPPRTHPEDYCICDLYRTELEQRHGIVFAPVELAVRFAFEDPDPGTPTFGFHGFYNFPSFMARDELRRYLDVCGDEVLRSFQGRKIAKSLYRGGRYADARRVLAARFQGPWRMRLNAAELWLRSGVHQIFHR